MKSLPKKILIASNNQGKITEISQMLNEIGVEAVAPLSLKAFENFEEPEESGQTFAENSLIKAKFYAEKSGLTALADDSGLCIVNLDGKPGIHSARFTLDENGEKNFPKTFEKIFAMLKEKNASSEAFFICNLTIFDPELNVSASFEGKVDGKLVEPRGNKGFGYDPIFVKNGMTQSFGEIEAFKKDKISHRGQAFEKFLNWAKNL